MKKTGILFIASLLLLVLLGAMVFRYGQFETFDKPVRYIDGWTGMEVEKFEKATRYIDRWTGMEWVKVNHSIYGPSGESRELAKYSEPSSTMAMTDEEIVGLMRILKTENALLFTWWALLALCLVGIAAALVKPRVVLG